ncbi:MAG: DNA translocase FtsK 4TM domain-containing protein [Halieaceae bacterium]|nr:DNA translocase FtsK 4TM domain-containing protein [Halieaceae bacterium]
MSLNNTVRNRLGEGALIGVTASCIYLLIALFSYNPKDPAWSTSGISDQTVNSAGVFGAYLADISFSIVGYWAFSVPILLALKAVQMIFERMDDGDRWRELVALRSLGFALIVASGCALASLNQEGSSALPQGAGGIVGLMVGQLFNDWFSSLGARVLLVASFLFGVSIFTGLSWLKAMDQLGEWTLRYSTAGWHWCHYQIGRIREKRAKVRAQQTRKIEIQQHVETQKLRTPPKIKAPSKPVEKSERAEKEKQVNLFQDIAPVGEVPPLELLDPATRDPNKGFSKDALEGMSRLLELKLKDFGITAEVVAVYPGPVITRFEIQPAAGVKVSRISNLAKDLARSLAVISVRVVEVIPGKSVVGIEIPNEDREIVNFREVLSSRAFDTAKSPLTLALGHDISGLPVVADLAKMPHLLVAGTTGSGKSVGVNAMLLSLLYKCTPDDVRLLLVDPKMLELSVYDGVPHLLTPVITDMKDAANGLRWCVAEMERRYKVMASLGVRNLSGYNRKIEDAKRAGETIDDPTWRPSKDVMFADQEQVAPPLEHLPSIVVVIDEFADMIMIVGKKVEELIARIAQKARAAGIHLILATQRPSVDVITGLIKANVPTRIAFQVSSRIDSRTILDQGGAEQLLGHGDMLYLPPGSGLPTRVHGAFCSDDEVHRVVADWKKRGKPDFIEGLLEEGGNTPVTAQELQNSGSDDPESDPLYDEAVHFVLESRRASISSVQRKLRIGYNRAARLIETMEAAGVVSAMGHNGQRDVLAPPPVDV